MKHFIFAIFGIFLIGTSHNLYCKDNKTDTLSLSYNTEMQEYYYSYINNEFDNTNKEKLKQFFLKKFPLSKPLKESDNNLTITGSLPFTSEISGGFGTKLSTQYKMAFLLNLSFKDGRYRLYINKIRIIDNIHGDAELPLESYLYNQTELSKGLGLSKKKSAELNNTTIIGIYEAFDKMNKEAISYIKTSSINEENW